MADVSWLLELPAPSDICTQIVSKTLFYLFVSCRLITTSQRFLVFQVLDNTDVFNFPNERLLLECLIFSDAQPMVFIHFLIPE